MGIEVFFILTIMGWACLFLSFKFKNSAFIALSFLSLVGACRFIPEPFFVNVGTFFAPTIQAPEIIGSILVLILNAVLPIYLVLHIFGNRLDQDADIGNKQHA